MSSYKVRIPDKDWVEIPVIKGDIMIEGSEQCFITWTDNGLPPNPSVRGHQVVQAKVVSKHNTEKLYVRSYKSPCTVTYTEII